MKRYPETNEPSVGELCATGFFVLVFIWIIWYCFVPAARGQTPAPPLTDVEALAVDRAVEELQKAYGDFAKVQTAYANEHPGCHLQMGRGGPETFCDAPKEKK